MRTIRLTPAEYPLREYERYLVEWQLKRLGFDQIALARPGWSAVANGDARTSLIKRLRAIAFVDRVEVDGKEALTQSRLLEMPGSERAGRSRAAAHTYSVHGFHAYRGKFYPQIARALIAGANSPPGSVILDPFAGSGTTLVEATLMGSRSIGLDLSPMATFITDAKLRLLGLDPNEYAGEVERMAGRLLEHDSTCGHEHGTVVGSSYLARWFDPLSFRRLDCCLRVIQSTPNEYARLIGQLGLSRRIRSWSLQNPEDLRVRRRVVPPDTTNALTDLARWCVALVAKLRAEPVNGRIPKWHVECADSRDPKAYEAIGLTDHAVGAVITSPPYATALPYIDTDRLSLLALGLIDGGNWRNVEASLIGSREIGDRERRQWEDRIDAGLDLPQAIERYLRQLIKSVKRDATAGFRRRNMPALLARYFVGMDEAIRAFIPLCRDRALVAVVVGDSRTRLDGAWVVIPTRDFLANILTERGLDPLGRIDLTDQPAYSIHRANVIKEESILLHSA